MTPFSNPVAGLTPHSAAGKRVVILATLLLDQPLHIGSGRSNDETDSAVITDHHGKPIIPGSSLRGALRTRCERLADALLPGEICFLYPTTGTVADVECVSVKPSLLRDDVTNELFDDVRLWNELPNVLCPACRVFGASGYWASKIRIPDLSLDDKTPTGATLQEIRDGVGIHRDTLTAAPQIKYDLETVTRAARFRMEIVVENAEDDDLSMLALGLADLYFGRMTLGGSSSRGLGGCHLEDGTVSVIDFGKRKELIAYLTGDKQTATEPLDKWLRGYLKRWIGE